MVGMAIAQLNKQIEELHEAKNQAVRNADYELAAAKRDEMDQLREARAKLTGKKIEAQIYRERKLSSQDLAQAEKMRAAGWESYNIEHEDGHRELSVDIKIVPMAVVEENEQLRDALSSIIGWTNPTTPGIYSHERIREINTMAREALGRALTDDEDWHYESDSDSPSERNPLAEELLNLLSGDLNHNNVAAAKDILKKLV